MSFYQYFQIAALFMIVAAIYQDKPSQNIIWSITSVVWMVAGMMAIK